jgi:Putative MetA-pathway of phenol degradation
LHCTSPEIRVRLLFVTFAAALIATPAMAGPPYVTDDPEPTDYQHFEIYGFTAGTDTRGGREGETGVDFNYGAAPNLQLSTVIGFTNNDARAGRGELGVGNIEFGVKYEFLHQDDFGWDVSAYPQIFLPSFSSNVGERHVSVLLPIWMQKDFGAWSTFGGGGCAFDNGDGAINWCELGWSLTRQVLPNLNLGIEVYHQTSDEKGGKPLTGVGPGAIYDLNEHYHLLASWGPGIQNSDTADRMTWYVAAELTF